jgi:hypothetical protein
MKGIQKMFNSPFFVGKVCPIDAMEIKKGGFKKKN